MKIFLLGDSHTRSYNKSQKIIPIFLGPGSSINLMDKNSIKKILNIIIKLLKTVISKNDMLIINLASPDILRLCVEGTYPHKTHKINEWNKEYKKEIDSLFLPNNINILINNYKFLIDTIQKYHENTFILSTSITFMPIIKVLLYFNYVFETIYKNKYINLFKNTVNMDNFTIKTQYLNFNFKNETEYPFYKNYEYDPLHLKNNMTDLLLNYIEKIYKNIDNENIVNNSKFNIILKKNHFNCYSII
uniref:SGNH domain-containing protein n=1 Tax=viral metagenome TaxID=1070528 RepID=A0A6C0BYR0_9ZZZZ